MTTPRMTAAAFRQRTNADRLPTPKAVLGAKVRQPRQVRPHETHVQAQIVAALKAAGYWVFETGQRWGGGKPTGLTAGTPDLYVWRPGWGPRHIALEVKRDEAEARQKSRRGHGKAMSKPNAQRDLIEGGGAVLVWDTVTAITAVEKEGRQ